MFLLGTFECLLLLPSVVFVAFIVYLFFWLNEKRRRDELVASFLIEIRQIQDEIHKSIDEALAKSK